MLTSEPYLTVQHFRDAGLCTRGLKKYMDQHTEVDFARFLRDGATREEVERHLPNAFLERAIAQKEKSNGQ